MIRIDHADEFKMEWYKSGEDGRPLYFIAKGYIRTLPDRNVVLYNPLELYKENPIDRHSDNLHHVFANINLLNNKAIAEFYNKYGPLGLYEREVFNIVSFPPHLSHLYPMPSKRVGESWIDSPIAGVKWNSNELMPLRDLQKKYHISNDKLILPNPGDKILKTINITALDTWESLKEFKEMCKNFKALMALIVLLFKKETDIKNIKTILSDDLLINIADFNDKEVLHYASHYVRREIAMNIENRVSPSLEIDDTGYRLSNKIIWKCDSLLTCMYLMAYCDITRGANLKRCEREKCRKWFESSRKETEYCSVKCQVAEKSKRYRTLK